VKRTVTRLADGRELFYYDRRDDADRSTADLRDLPPRPLPSELRYDPLMDEWVAIAGHRQTRTHLPSAAECPLCPAHPGSEIPSPYDVAVFENRFPSFSFDPGVSTGKPDTVDSDPTIGAVRPGVGRCEVVCFTSDHDASFTSLKEDQVELVMEAWADRTAELSRLPGVEQVFCFENRGAEIGITLPHPHGQIYAYPYVTPRTRQMLGAASRHRGGNLFADVLAAERAGPRVVVANEHWTAFVPAAARYPFEIHIFPHRQVPDLPALQPAERSAFGPLYIQVLRHLDGLFGVAMPYVAAWHQAPITFGRELAYLHLQLFSIRRAPDKLKFLAGSESAMGAFVNDVRPEEAARMLRESR
jgi:UDPglucose--hexose-1-phosphate uridylyltransferase